MFLTLDTVESWNDEVDPREEAAQTECREHTIEFILARLTLPGCLRKWPLSSRRWPTLGRCNSLQLLILLRLHAENGKGKKP